MRKPPSPPKARAIREPGLFSWIIKDRVKFLIDNRDKNIKELYSRIKELENKMADIMPDVT